MATEELHVTGLPGQAFHSAPSAIGLTDFFCITRHNNAPKTSSKQYPH